MTFTMVLEDNLAEELCKFKNQGDYNDKIVERILHYYKPPILLSKVYMPKYFNDEATLKQIVASNSNLSFYDSLEKLAQTTLYKIVLSKDKNDFPYVNIFGDKIENNLTATFGKNEEREKAKAHLKALFENAKCIFIYDKYLCKNQDSFLKFAKECFSQKQLSIFYPKRLEFPQKLRGDLKNFCQEWIIKENQNSEINDNFDDLHDRYIIIDNQVQIILTSGIGYLMDKTKDFTYIIRLIG